MLLSKIDDIASVKPNRWFCALQLIDNSLSTVVQVPESSESVSL